jgi:hypothetical protein
MIRYAPRFVELALQVGSGVVASSQDLRQANEVEGARKVPMDWVRSLTASPDSRGTPAYSQGLWTRTALGSYTALSQSYSPIGRPP